MGMAPAQPAVRDARIGKPIGNAMPKAGSGRQSKAEMDAIASALAEALERHGKHYRKVAQVRARQVMRETPVTTILADGAEETKNVAVPGDYIVTGAGGERWVVKPGTFEARYALKRGRKTVYLARGEAIAVENPFRRPISILAPWGERQHGTADCMIADMFDPAAGRRAGEPYIIARAEFRRTYRAVRAPAKKARPLPRAHRRTK
jgi:hypothetical protein